MQILPYDVIDTNDGDWLLLFRTLDEGSLSNDPSITALFTEKSVCHSLALAFVEH